MNIFLASLELKIKSTAKIDLQLTASAKYTFPLISTTQTYSCNYKTSKSYESLSNFKQAFKGESFDKQTMPYSWMVYQNGNSDIAIKITFFNHPKIDSATAIINSRQKVIDITITPHKSDDTVTIDPLFHPLGGLLMVHLAHKSGGFIIHASGVSCSNKGYLFSAVSGTGKSTMASLWEQSGALIINDDRLWIQKIAERWNMFNTPMIWYSQKPAMATVDKIFLLHQSKNNLITQIKGINASMQVMSNCMQHLYEKEMTKSHLNKVLDFTSQIPVYSCAFKPDKEIVEIIKELNE
ncbi:hypothetical protein QA597_10670 [Marinilabiliaceae bacterium ANBcel2]|nr:hypothetical protein [Marinilabiliaceae bacterium ANBcel2]